MRRAETPIADRNFRDPQPQQSRSGGRTDGRPERESGGLPPCPLHDGLAGRQLAYFYFLRAERAMQTGPKLEQEMRRRALEVEFAMQNEPWQQENKVFEAVTI